jgi:phage baseplate assembly protein gpV
MSFHAGAASRPQSRRAASHDARREMDPAMGIRGAFRVGLVREQNAADARVRVVFSDRDEMQSYWLPVVYPKTQNDKAYWIPDVGEQVVCMMDARDEAGAVLGAIYSSADTTPEGMTADHWHVTTKDGASFDYDRAAHVLDLKFQDGAELKYDAAAHAFSATMPQGATFTVTLNGATLSIDASGNVNIKPANGDINFQTDQFSTSLNQLISTFNIHVHSGVQTGDGDTAATTTPIQ